MKKKILVIALIVCTIIIIGVPLLLNIPCISNFISWYFKGLRTADYKMTYISLIGGIIGVWMTVGTTLLIQNIFDSNHEKEIEKIINNIVSTYLLEEIKKNHEALTTCNSEMHKQVARNKTILQMVKDKELVDINCFQKEFSLSNWKLYAKVFLDTDIETYMVLSKLYDCYDVIVKFNIANINKMSDLKKSGIYDYEKIYNKFKKRFGSLMTEDD